MSKSEERVAQAERELDDAGGLEAVVRDLIALSAEIDTFDPDDLMGPDDDEPTIDCRLRYFAGSWEFLSGDASYDTDHRGHWGASSVTPNLTMEDAQSIGTDLIDQVLDSLAIADDDG